MKNWFTLSLLASIIIGIMSVIMGELGKKIPVPVLLITIAICWLVGFTFISMLLPAEAKVNIMPTIKSLCWLIVIAGILSVLGNWALFSAVKLAPNTGLPLAIFGSQAIVAALIALIFLKQPITATQWMGIIVCVVGVIILNLEK